MDNFNLPPWGFDDMVAADMGIQPFQLQPDFGLHMFEYHPDMDSFINHMNQLNNSFTQEIRAIQVHDDQFGQGQISQMSQDVQLLELDPLPTSYTVPRLANVSRVPTEVEVVPVDVDPKDEVVPPSVENGEQPVQQSTEELKVNSDTCEEEDDDVRIESEVFRCEECRQPFESRSRLATHQKKSHCKEKKCGICGRFFRNNMLLYLHGLTFHPNAEMEDEGLESEVLLINSNVGQRKPTKRRKRNAKGQDQDQKRSPMKIRKLEDELNKVAITATGEDCSTSVNVSDTPFIGPNGTPLKNDDPGAMEEGTLESPVEESMPNASAPPEALQLAPSTATVDEFVDEGIDVELPSAISILGKRNWEAVQSDDCDEGDDTSNTAAQTLQMEMETVDTELLGQLIATDKSNVFEFQPKKTKLDCSGSDIDVDGN